MRESRQKQKSTRAVRVFIKIFVSGPEIRYNRAGKQKFEVIVSGVLMFATNFINYRERNDQGPSRRTPRTRT